MKRPKTKPERKARKVERTVRIDSELDSALVCLALSRGVPVEQVIADIVRKNRAVKKEVAAVRAEPDTGVLAVSRRLIRAAKTK